MPSDLLVESVRHRPVMTNFAELTRFVNRHTQQQVQDLCIHQRDEKLVVTGRSPTYYVKQLATQAIQTSFPSVRLSNEICVG